MTVLGLGSYACAWAIGVPGYEPPHQPMDAFALVARAAALGLYLVQIADNLPLDSLGRGERRRLKQFADEQNVRIEVGTRGIATNHLLNYIQLAVEFGSPILRVVVDTRDHHPSPDEVVTLVSSVLRELEKNGITLAIENHDRFKAQTLADMMNAIGHPQVGICLDTVNSFGALEGPEHVVNMLGRYVVNLHLKEFTVRRLGHNMGFEVTGAPAGQGMLNVPWLLGALQKFDRDFNAIIELWPAPEPSMADTIAKEAAWLEQSVSYLRTLITD